MSRFRRGTVILALALTALTGAGARAQDRGLEERIKGTEDELQRLRRELGEQRKRIAEIEKEEKNLGGLIERLEREEQLTRRLLNGLGEREQMLGEQIGELRVELESNEALYRYRLGVFSARLKEIYKEGPRSAWQELLSAADAADLLQRYKFLSLIAERDAALIADLRRAKTGIEVQEAGLTELLHEVSVSRAEKERELEKLSENETKRRRNLASLQKRKNEHRRKAGELEAAENRLQRLMEELEKTRLEQAQAWGDYGEGDFLSLKGRMPLPVEGSVTRRFGRFRHPEYGTVTFNSGIDISTRTGEPVRAVARGRVEYAGDLSGYGNCIIVNHGGGYYTLYARTARIFVSQGATVERGAVIAEAGRDADGPGGSIHFEIRRSKTALDPGEWLRR